MLPVKTVEYGFSDSTSDLRFRPTTELIYQDKRFIITVFYKKLHIGQMRSIGTKTVFYALPVSYIDKDMIEYTCPGTFIHRDKKSALQHILQQGNRFQTEGLTTCVCSGNDQ